MSARSRTKPGGLPPEGGTLFTTLKLRHVTLLLALMKVVKLAQSEKAASPGAGSAAVPTRPTKQSCPLAGIDAAGQTIASETVS